MSRQSSGDYEKPPIEGKHYDPEGYSALKSFRNGQIVAGIVIVLIVFGVMSSGEPNPGSIIATIIFVAIVTTGMNLAYNAQLEEHKEKIFIEKRKEKEILQTTVEASEDLLVDANKKLGKQMEQLKSIQKAQTIGDIIISNNHAPVVISSTIKDSFNVITASKPELASAIKTLGGFIENSGNKEAAKYFNELHKQIANDEKNPTILKALWDGIEKVLPSVKNLADVVAKITALF